MASKIVDVAWGFFSMVDAEIVCLKVGLLRIYIIAQKSCAQFGFVIILV